MSKLRIYCLITMITVAYSQITSPGSCPKYEAVNNFDVEAYLGRWFELARYENYFQPDGDCVTATYSLRDDGDVRVINSMTILSNQMQFSLEGVAVLSYPNEIPLQGKFNVSFDGTPINSNYWILGTDYTNYSVVWSCTPVSIIRVEFAWILSRTPELSPEIEQIVEELINEYLNESSLRITKQNDERCLNPVETTS